MAITQMLLHNVFHMDAGFIPFTSNGILPVKMYERSELKSSQKIAVSAHFLYPKKPHTGNAEVGYFLATLLATHIFNIFGAKIQISMIFKGKDRFLVRT